ncbi:uncharacterized protein isoform X2 [Rhodnius prolixus]|uniref:uncharacterized protein isoform X2 n=1 Tax=Rhodnius prolixus TaxID=13249 RepID=UPI003D18FA73
MCILPFTMASFEEFVFDDYEDSESEIAIKCGSEIGISCFGESDEGFLSVGQRLVNAILERKHIKAEYLIKNGADVNYRMNESGWTPLMYAASIGAKDAVDLLLNNGADPNYHYEHRTPLMCLFRRGHFQLMSCLLSCGANIEAVSHNGWTALFYAVNSGNLEAVKLLKHYGSNLLVKDNDGQTIYDLASTNNFNYLSDIMSGDAYDDHYSKELFSYQSLDNYQFVTSEMPDGKLSVFNGFYEDTLLTITTLGLKHLIPLFIEKKVGYGTFLTCTNEDWKTIGVEFRYDRIRLIWYANQVLKYRWTRNVILNLEKHEFNLFWLAQIMSNNVRIIHILKATLHVSIRELYKTEKSWNKEQIITALEDSLIKLKILKESIKKLPSVVEKISDKQNIVSVDYISPCSHCKTYFIHFLNELYNHPFKLLFVTSIFALFKMFKC